MLTTFHLDEYIFGALEAGASGFLLKDTPPRQIIDGVRIVARGESILSPGDTAKLVERYASRREETRSAAARSRLAAITTPT